MTGPRISHVIIPPLLALLAACGGGSGPSGAINPPTPSATLATMTVTGTVVQLAGPLAHTTQSCTGQSPAPCPANPPTATATPQAGPPIAGATVYVMPSTALASTSVPASAVSATTDSAGHFSATFSSSLISSGAIALAVVNGSQIVASPRASYGYGDQTFTLGNLPPFGAVTQPLDPDLGTSDKGFIVAHLVVPVAGNAANAGTIFLDQPSDDERSGLASINYWRGTVGAPPVIMDMALEMALRRDTPNETTPEACTLTGAFAGGYTEFGGFGSMPFWNGDIDAVSWSMAFFTIATNENNHPVSVGVNAAATWGGAAMSLLPHGCGTSPAPTTLLYQVAENA